jgi:hypothetical protein
MKYERPYCPHTGHYGRDAKRSPPVEDTEQNPRVCDFVSRFPVSCLCSMELLSSPHDPLGGFADPACLRGTESVVASRAVDASVFSKVVDLATIRDIPDLALLLAWLLCLDRWRAGGEVTLEWGHEFDDGSEVPLSLAEFPKKPLPPRQLAAVALRLLRTQPLASEAHRCQSNRVFFLDKQDIRQNGVPSQVRLHSISLHSASPDSGSGFDLEYMSWEILVISKRNGMDASWTQEKSRIT